MEVLFEDGGDAVGLSIAVLGADLDQSDLGEETLVLDLQVIECVIDLVIAMIMPDSAVR